MQLPEIFLHPVLHLSDLTKSARLILIHICFLRLESFHLVFLGCALWRIWFCYGHVLKPASVWRQFQVGDRSR